MDENLVIKYNYTSLSESLYIVFETKSGKCSVTKNGEVTKKVLSEVDKAEFANGIIGYSIFWPNENINNRVIDGFEISLSISCGDEVSEKYFKNVVPENIREFNRVINKVVGNE